MSKLYRIHPSIGIARLGTSADAFFVGPEIPGAPAVEIDTEGVERPVALHKQAGEIKRQGARFHVFETEVGEDGTETVSREITADEAQIVWTVQVANRKAAATRFTGDGTPRNPGVAEVELVIAPEFDPISGRGQRQAEKVTGRFRGELVPLGELRTDAKGRLIVLGGNGHSASVPAGQGITGFADNKGWYDDTADGSIDATVTFPDGQSVTAEGSWVVVAPPDFAPGVLGLTTLWDVAFQAAVTRGWRSTPAHPSFRQHVLPILERAAGLRWVNQWGFWNDISRDWATLSRQNDATAEALREQVWSQIKNVQESEILNDFRFTAVQHAILDAWLAGEFEDDFAAPPPESVLSPDGLDRAALDATMGGGFFPGIEAGILMTQSALYGAPFRLTRAVMTPGGQPLRPGDVTARMAVPWQADFWKCAGGWWPAQRPDTVLVRVDDPEPSAVWTQGIQGHGDLVQNFWRLGFIEPCERDDGETVYVEVERDPALPRIGPS